MGFILLSFFFIYYYFIVIVVCIILCGQEMLLHFCQVKRVTRWTDCYTWGHDQYPDAAEPDAAQGVPGGVTEGQLYASSP